MIWPGHWEDATGFLSSNNQGLHTGADLNLNHPHFDLNAHSQVVAIGDGTVTFAKLFSTTEWGKLVVIDHGMVDGRPLFSRYGHVEDIIVTKGQTVRTGEPIAAVGNGEELFPYHLHFDISLTEMLRTRPGHWPRTGSQLLTNYVNPQDWLQAHVTPGETGRIPLTPAQVYFVIASIGLRVRQDHSTSALQVGTLVFGTKVLLEDTQTVNQDSYNWGRIRGGHFHGDWMAMGKADLSEMFVSRHPPGR